MNYLEILVDKIHSCTVATLGDDGYPVTRIIDMMYFDDKGVYFLTAKGKAFYKQLMEQKFIAVSATKDKMSVSIRGKVKNTGKQYLDILFDKNPYMKDIYPGDSKEALDVFCIYEAQGDYFDISVPSHIVRDSFAIGQKQVKITGYYIHEGCIGCRLCYSVCPQKCIDISSVPAVIDQNHCLHCGRCMETCPKRVIRYESE